MDMYINGDAARLPLADGSVQVIVTSPPYAQQRAHTYGGVDAGEYVGWFLPIADELAAGSAYITYPGRGILYSIGTRFGYRAGFRSTRMRTLTLARMAINTS